MRRRPAGREGRRGAERSAAAGAEAGGGLITMSISLSNINAKLDGRFWQQQQQQQVLRVMCLLCFNMNDHRASCA
jgi:hypothetical protein